MGDSVDDCTMMAPIIVNRVMAECVELALSMCNIHCQFFSHTSSDQGASMFVLAFNASYQFSVQVHTLIEHFRSHHESSYFYIFVHFSILIT